MVIKAVGAARELQAGDAAVQRCGDGSELVLVSQDHVVRGDQHVKFDLSAPHGLQRAGQRLVHTCCGC
jgi:hypothetical protein